MTSITEVTGNLFIYLQLCGNLIFDPLYLIIRIAEDQTFCKFEILTAVFLKIYGFWVSSFHLPNDSITFQKTWIFKETFCF